MRTTLLLAVGLTLVTLACAFKIPSHTEFIAQGRQPKRSVQGSCTVINYQCVNQGGNCGYNLTTSVYSVCLGDSCTSNGTCPYSPALGASCDPTADSCGVFFACHPVTSVCVNPNTILPPGASCSADSQCLYGAYPDAVASCVSGKCKGIALGSSCSGTDECAGRAYCPSGTCVATLSVGASCDDGDDTVAAGVCNSGTVIRIGSLSSGQTCTTSDACGDGLYCPQSGGVCTSASTGGALCSVDSDCPTNGVCQCDGSHANTTCIVPTANPSGSTSLIQAFGDCVDSHSCIDGDSSCIKSNCQSQYCNYYNFEVSHLGSSLPSCYLNYFVGQYEASYAISCKANSASLASLSIGALAVVFAVAIL